MRPSRGRGGNSTSGEPAGESALARCGHAVATGGIMHTKWTRAVEVCLAVGLLTFAGCGEGSEKAGNADLSKRATTTTSLDAAATPVLNTFINKSIEIDQLGTGLSPDDANLFVGADPADGSASAQKPTGGPATFIDWNDLGGDLANHKLGDATTGKDPTSFPQSNECVGSSQVLSKMDLTYVGVANNATYAYFAVQRSNNNGDAGYYWLFTRKTPHLTFGQGPCKADQQQLLYDISGPSAGSVGDVLLGGHFHPNGTPLLRVFHATRDASNVTAVDAVDFTSSLWLEDPSGVAAVAVNTTPTAPGSWGSDGVRQEASRESQLHLVLRQRRGHGEHLQRVDRSACRHAHGHSNGDRSFGSGLLLDDGDHQPDHQLQPGHGIAVPRGDLHQQL